MSDDLDDDAAWAPAPPPRAAAPALLPGYRDAVVVARGGDSVVYRAHQDSVDRDVAIKVVLLDDPESIARFERELAITVRLGRQHPNIMTVLATGTTTQGQPCLVMDYVELGSLHDRLLERGSLPVSEVVAAGTVIADALAFAHGQGVLHRDVKPQNVLVLPTSYVLADFGLARAIDAGHSASLERFSYRHASPQILDGEPPTVADDVYALGSTMFTLLDGRAPFAADDPDEDSALSYLRRARTEQPREFTRDDLPAGLAAIVARCLARDRADRFAGAQELRVALDSVSTETRSWAPDEPAASPAPVASDPLPLVVAPVDSPPVDSPPVDSPPVDSPPVDGPPVAEERSGEEGRPGRHAAGRTFEAPTVTPTPALPVDVTPDPVAVSALAHLASATPAPAVLPGGHSERAPDDEATGTRPAEPLPVAPPPRRPTRWIWLAAVVVLALVAGVVVGILRSRSDDHPSASGTSGSSSAAPLPPVVDVSNLPSASVVPAPALAPTITRLVRNKEGNLEVTWTDPSKGGSAFAVVLADPGVKQTPLTTAQPGTTTVTLAGVSKGRHCLSVWALGLGSSGETELGKSTARCTG